MVWLNRVAVTAALGLVVSVIMFFRARKRKAEIRDRMKGRRRLDDNEFGRCYFSAESAQAASTIRRILARHVRADVSRLQPDDRPYKDLHMESLRKGSVYQFVLEVEDEFGVELGDDLLDESTTFNDIVKAVVRLKRESDEQ